MSIVFRDTLVSCGIFLDDTSFVICHEPGRSARHLESSLKHQQYRLDEFVESMSTYFADEKNIRVSTMPFQGPDSDRHLSYGQGDTLLKLLLRIQALQIPLIQLLFMKILELATEHPESLEDESYQNFQFKILNHIRWCEVLYDAETVINIMLDSIQVL
jgi:hypothetical protein